MKNLGIALLAAGLLTTAAAARDYPNAGTAPSATAAYGAEQSPSLGSSPSRADRADFDRSGTRGRWGLGGTPFRPEGPGNVSG
jgi:hypothetical protein